VKRTRGGAGRGMGWTNEHLVGEVLDELVIERTGGEQSVEVGSEQLRKNKTGGKREQGFWARQDGLEVDSDLCNKVDVLERGDEDVAERDDLSLQERRREARPSRQLVSLSASLGQQLGRGEGHGCTDVLVLDVLEELELSVRPL
jgi:hypothetical protein